MKNVAIEGMTILPVEHGVVLSGLVVDTLPSHDVLVDGKGVYSADVAVTVASAVFEGYTAVDLSFTLHPSAEYFSVDGSKALMEGDTSDTVTASGSNPELSPPQLNFPVTIKVSSAAQESVKAE